MKITIHLPAVAPNALSNLVGLAGVLAVVIAVGALAGNWWWSVLAGGTAAVVLASLAQLGAEPQPVAAAAAAPAEVPPAPVQQASAAEAPTRSASPAASPAAAATAAAGPFLAGGPVTATPIPPRASLNGTP